MIELSFNQMEELHGGASFIGCIGGSAFSVGLFIAGAAVTTALTAGAAAVAIIGLYGGIGLACFT